MPQYWSAACSPSSCPGPRNAGLPRSSSQDERAEFWARNFSNQAKVSPCLKPRTCPKVAPSYEVVERDLIGDPVSDGGLLDEDNIEHNPRDGRELCRYELPARK